MRNIFDNSSSQWVRYYNYIWREIDGKLYLMPAENAKPEIYDPLKNGKQAVIDALNIGRLCMSKKPDDIIREAILEFAQNYGMLGLMTALPTTANFMDYEYVYLPKNRFIKAETMATEDYLALFFPTEKPDVTKRGVESVWNIENDRTMIALAMAMSGKPTAMNMSFQRGYADRYDWLKQQFTDWIFIFSTSLLYYEGSDDEDTKELFKQAMSAFDVNAPTYHIELRDKPTVVWDFHSLLLMIQMMFSTMLTDEKNPLRLCKHCNKVFEAKRPDNLFCSAECKNRFNVYKSRSKDR